MSEGVGVLSEGWDLLHPHFDFDVGRDDRLAPFCGKDAYVGHRIHTH
jgi:hypothetical protein